MIADTLIGKRKFNIALYINLMAINICFCAQIS